MGESQTVSAGMRIAIGILAVFFGVALLLLALLNVWYFAVAELGDDFSYSSLTKRLLGIAALIGVGGFCLTVGSRLIANRTIGKGMGLLTPTGWRAVGLFFACLGLLLLVGVVTRGGALQGAVSILVFSLFSFWCFQAARAISSRTS